MTSRLRNVHCGLPAPGAQHTVAVVRGDYEYWHYCCDGVDDRGWGCGYRTLQTLCSWVRLQPHHHHQQQQQQHNQHPHHCCSHFSIGSNNTADVTNPEHSKNSGDSDVIKVIGSGDVTDGDDVIEAKASGDVTDGDDVINYTSVSAVGDQSSIRRVASGVENQISVVVSGVHNQTGICIIGSGVNGQTSITDVDNGVENRAGVSIVTSSVLKQGDDPVSAASYNNSDPRAQVREGVPSDVPAIRQIQQALVAMGDKPAQFVDSRDWIGSYEVCLCLDFFYQVPCKIVHVGAGAGLACHLSELHKHFTSMGGPIMMGGDCDASSKGILGVCTDPGALLVLDPHCSSVVECASQLLTADWVKWVALEDFHQTSFYNLCLPQLHVCTE
ncbi:ufm1-specific protease 1-like [Littorina saxatilis]|uniref:UFSP1/2/DUB catalytic domain-containing protein n=1 Tax=Littorina saxatilis TaxID=31220 RepID=A0AAN9BLD4_9CAEN